ncbi:MAG: acyl-CoA dehydrogenase [Pedobacter sp.]|nr:acyl-CoA dehydrogenase [Pedobacter sp.]
MNTLLLAGIIASGLLMLFSPRAGLVAALAIFITLLTLSVRNTPYWHWLWLPWALTLLWSLKPLRRLVLIPPALYLVRRLLPPISDTERDAIAAGSVWFEADLFSGRPDWDKLLAIPQPQLALEEQAFLDGPTEELCEMLDDWVITHELRDLPPRVWEFIRGQGFLGMIIPKEFGGLGFSAQAHSAVVGKIASRSVSAAVTVMVPNSLGPGELLLHYGTEEQKKHYLPRLASGQEIPCFALTGPEAGSDAGAIPDSGIVCRGMHEGREVLGIKLTWEKRYITLGPVATLLGLAFRLHDPEHLLGSVEDVGITLALIPTHHPGVHIGRRHFPGNQAFMNGPNHGNDVFIPLTWIIGGREYAGRGWMMLMNCLAAGRAISLPALGTTSAKTAARYSGEYARVRKQFKLPIGKLEGVEEVLARIGSHAYTLEAARRMTCVALDMGEKPAVVSAIMKHEATERMRMTLNAAMDIHGGKGICEGPKNYLASAYQAIPVGITVEGANILTRSLIIFGQGAMRCHPFLLREIEAAGLQDRAKSVEDFDDAFTAHVSHIMKNAALSLLHGLTFSRFAASPSTATAHWYRKLARLSASLALTADAALALLGGELKRRESLSGRFADCLAELYLSSAVLKRWEDEGRPAEDLALVDYSLALSTQRIEEQLAGILANFPNALVGGLLRILVFPLGRRHAAPKDKTGHAVASLMLKPSASFDRLSPGIFISSNRADATGALEYAFQMVSDTKAIEGKLRDARKAGLLLGETPEAGVQAGIISAAEAQLLHDTAAAVREVIMVDDFSNEELSGKGVATVQHHAA